MSRQLDLFADSAPVTRPPVPGGTNTPPAPPARHTARGRAEIPAICPVVGRPVCYRADCRHYLAGGCAHPEAGRRRK